MGYLRRQLIYPKTMKEWGLTRTVENISFCNRYDIIYPMRNDFKVDVKLDAPEYIVAGTKLRVKFTYEHLLNPEQDHHELDWIGVYLVGQTRGKDRLIAKANVPEGKQGELVFDGNSKDLGTYEIVLRKKYSIGKARQTLFTQLWNYNVQAIYPSMEIMKFL